MFIALIASALPIGFRSPRLIWRALAVGTQAPGLHPSWTNFASKRAGSPHNGEAREVAQHQQAIAAQQAR